MGISERRERDRLRRQEAILDAAETLFFDNGFQLSTMDDIAKTAELSKATLYLYFKSKDEIANAIKLRAMEILKHKFETVLQSPGSGLEKVRSLGSAYYQFAREYPNYFEALIAFEVTAAYLNDQESFGYQCHLCSEHVMELVAGAVAAGIDDKSIRPDLDPLKTAYLLWGQTKGVINIVVKFSDHIKDYHSFDATGLIPDLFDLIERSLKR